MISCTGRQHYHYPDGQLFINKDYQDSLSAFISMDSLLDTSLNFLHNPLVTYVVLFSWADSTFLYFDSRPEPGVSLFPGFSCDLDDSCNIGGMYLGRCIQVMYNKKLSPLLNVKALIPLTPLEEQTYHNMENYETGCSSRVTQYKRYYVSKHGELVLTHQHNAQ